MKLWFCVSRCSRYIALCMPYRASTLVTMQNAKKCVITVIILSFLYNLPRYFENILSVTYTNGTRSLHLSQTVLGESRIYQLVYFDILYYIFSFVLPLLLLIGLNTRLIVAYRALQAKRAKMNLRQESDNNITLVMIIIILSFIVCQAPARIVQVVWGYTSPGCPSYQYYVIQIATVLEVLNSSNNFFIYTAFRKQFRAAMLDTFCPCSHCTRNRGFAPVNTTNGRSTIATTYSSIDKANEDCNETFCWTWTWTSTPLGLSHWNIRSRSDTLGNSLAPFTQDAEVLAKVACKKWNQLLPIGVFTQHCRQDQRIFASPSCVNKAFAFSATQESLYGSHWIGLKMKTIQLNSSCLCFSTAEKPSWERNGAKCLANVTPANVPKTLP